MAEETTEQQLQKLRPRRIDDLIREHRDELRHALATEDEQKALETTFADGPVTHRLRGWNILVMHVPSERGQVSSPHLIGTVVGTGESWITSHVVGIDFEQGLVQTKRSLYRIIGPRADEKDAGVSYCLCQFRELIRVLAWTNKKQYNPL